MSISSLVSRVIPTAIGFATGGPVGAFTAAVATEEGKKVEKQQKRAINEYNAQLEMRRQQLETNFGSSMPGAFPTPRPASIGQPSFFNRLGDIGSSIGNTLLTGLESAVPSVINRAIFGGSRPQSAAQGPALTTVTNVGAQESSGSGSIQAGVPALMPSLISGARSLLKSPGGQLALGGGTALVGSMFSGQDRGIRITRKMKSSFRNILNMTGGDLARAADIMGVDQGFYVQVLLKRFRNDGPVVTKAALRKTKQTVRRLKSMCDMYDSLRPTATRRRTPMKRATTTTLIKN